MDVVSQLAFQLQNKNVEGAGDELLTATIEEASKVKPNEEGNLVSFAGRCLEFMIPSPKVTRNITTACLDRCLNWDLKQHETAKNHTRQFAHSRISLPEELLTALLFAASENRPIIADSYEKLIIDRITNGSEPEALLALEIALNLPIARHRTRKQIVEEEFLKFWDTVTQRILTVSSDRLKELSKMHFRPCLDGFRKGIISVRDLIEWHGIEALFDGCEYKIFPDTWSASIAEVALFSLCTDLQDEPDILGRGLSYVKEVSRILLSTPTPWIKGRRLDREHIFHVRHWDFGESETRRKSKNEKKRLSIDPDALFVAFAFFAVMFEAAQERKMSDWLKGVRGIILDSIHSTLLARFEQVDPKAVQSELVACGFTSEQKGFVWRWVRKEINLAHQLQ